MEDEFRDDLGDIAGVLYETCRVVGQLKPQEALSALAAAIGITLAETGLPWSDAGWAEIGRAVKKVWEIQSAPDGDDPKVH